MNMTNNKPAIALAVALAVALAWASPASAQQARPPFPDGPGKDLFVASCGSCHDINRSRAGYTPEGWRTVLRMMENFGVKLAAKDRDTLTAYLIDSFPEPTRPPAVVIGGVVEAGIKMFAVPTPGSRPHDPLAARDGSIWYTGQMTNRLGRIDPKTGAAREFPLPTPHSGPHGLVEDRAGNIWYTGNHAALVGKLDPRSGRVTEYRMPDSDAKDPHTIAVDARGTVWFTLQRSNMIGRLDPATGAIRLVRSPTPRSRPYGLVINRDGVPVVVQFGTNKIATVDPKTMRITEHTLPDPDARPRRLAISPDGAVWYTDYPRGYLGRLDLKTGAHKEWLSPSGAKSRPYGIVFARGAIWYSESFAKPNTIVRFEPATAKFQSWEIPGGGDIVRNMDVTREGKPVTANSLTNQVGLIEVEVADQ
jgi:virginiamycin B lyase